MWTQLNNYPSFNRGRSKFQYQPKALTKFKDLILFLSSESALTNVVKSRILDYLGSDSELLLYIITGFNNINF